MTSATYFRNIDTLTSDQGVAIDPGSLWTLNGNTLVLVDDDEYHSHVYDADLFEAVP